MSQNSKYSKYIPRVARKTLLFEAACVWLIAGSILMYKGISLLNTIGEDVNWLIFLGCLVGGVVFFLVMFLKISDKYINRIKDFTHDRLCVFSFFGLKGYIMMFSMITLGIVLRKTGFVPVIIMGYFYFFMGTPLLLSAIRFLRAAIIHPKANK